MNLELDLDFASRFASENFFFGERHLTHLLADYMAYYNAERVHTRLGDSPKDRPTETRPSPAARVFGVPRVGGLHHWYVCAEAA